MNRKLLIAGILFLMLSLGAVLAQTLEVVEGVGTDLDAEAKCLACHAKTAEAWGNLSSHRLLMDCTTCHATTAPSGAGHAQAKACAACHSNASHPAGAACGVCHDAHGSSNAFLLKTSVVTSDGGSVPVRVTKPEGASAEGLARTGAPEAQAGKGLCEVCHDDTSVYNRKGTGGAHPTEFCGHCHDHESGFAPSRK